MPVWLALAALAGGLLLILRPKTATGYVNGQAVTLVVASIGDGCWLRADAAAAYVTMREACRLELGRTFTPSGPNSAFRTPEQQAALVGQLGGYASDGLAAAVGHSPHQAGIAVDLAGLDPDKANYDSTLRDWLIENCHSYGWQNKGDAFTKREPWHYEYHPEVYV